MEVVNLRLKLELPVEKPLVIPSPPGPNNPSEAVLSEAEVVYPDGPLPTMVYQREKLVSGNRIQGPALVVQMDSTVVVPPDWAGMVDPFGNLVLEPE